jgi:hypothetical protein
MKIQTVQQRKQAWGKFWERFERRRVQPRPDDDQKTRDEAERQLRLLEAADMADVAEAVTQ